MLITNLEQAEKIVSSFNDLRWVGWNIVSRKETPNGYNNKYGSFLNNKWGIDKIYPLTEKGWHLPSNYGEYRVKF